MNEPRVTPLAHGPALAAVVAASIAAWLVTHGNVKAIVWCAIPIVLAAVLEYGVRQRGLNSAAWRYLASSLALFGVAELMLTAEEQQWYDPPAFAPSYVGYLVANSLMLVGFVRLVRQAAPRLDRMDWIDCAIVTLGPGCLLWQFVIAPLAPEASFSLLDRGFLVGILVFDFAFALMAWRLLAGRLRLISGVMLLGSALLMALGDVAYDLLALHGGSIGGMTDLMYPVAWSLLAFAPFHGSINALTSRHDAGTELNTGHRQFATLATVASIAPVAMLVEELRGNHGSLVAVSLAAVVVFLLVVYRMQILVRALKGAAEALGLAATHDSLTGLANRAMLLQQMEHALAKRHGNDERCALVYADLNGFKATNDTFGHAVGDAVLVEVAARLKASCRPSDTVARLGGDEFVVLVEDIENREVVDQIVDRIRESLKMTQLVGDSAVRVSASLGVAFEPHESCTAAELLQAADQAMYAEKTASRTTPAASLPCQALPVEVHANR
jgi:diguanylate cyclase (GGDEF)-like protein